MEYLISVATFIGGRGDKKSLVEILNFYLKSNFD